MSISEFGSKREIDVFLAQVLMGWRLVVAHEEGRESEAFAWEDDEEMLHDFHNWSPTSYEVDADEVFLQLVKECGTSVNIGYDKKDRYEQEGWSVEVDGSILSAFKPTRREAICTAAVRFVQDAEELTR